MTAEGSTDRTSRAIRVLHLEDDVTDAEALGGCFDAGGISASVERVRGHPTFADALASRRFDLILLDYRAAEGGLFALTLARGLAPDTPVIVVSDELGEERAVEVLKRGAADCVRKERLDTLPVTVARALRDAEESDRRRHAEDALRAREAEFRRLAENLPDLVARIDRDRRFTYVNPAVGLMCGSAPAALVGCTGTALGLGAAALTVWDVAVDVAFEGFEAPLAFSLQTADGERHYVARLEPERDDAGRVVSVLAIMQDMTEQRQSEQQRTQLLAAAERARAEAEASNRAKDQFLAVLSHELRTPLHAIVGWVRLLREGVLTPEKREHAIETIERNAMAQTRIIEDLLDVSRMVAGTLRIDARPIAIGAVIADAVESVRPSAEPRRVTLAVDLPDDLGAIVGDPDRLRQVVSNVLSNAVKFTPEGGGVTLEARGDTDRVRVVVRDSGRGITPEFLPYIFDRFRQEDGSATRASGGLGLGLAIVRHLVEQHGGTIEATSAGPGQGAIFTITLPRGDAAAGCLPRPVRNSSPDIALDGVEVLVVDDDPDARELIEEALAQSGARVTTAASVEEARRALARTRPRVVLTDLGMPGEDGYALLREVQARRARSGEPMAAIALTGFAGLEVQQRALEAGFDRHLTKPVDLYELVTAVTRCVRRGGSTVA